MTKALLHLVTCLFLSVVAAALSGFYFGWPPHPLNVLQGLAELPAWSTLLVVGSACAWVSWRQRRAATVRRAALWGALWGLGIGTLGALVGCAALGEHESVAILGCWAFMSVLMAPYVALWLAAFCAWQRWRAGPTTGGRSPAPEGGLV